MMQGKFFKWNHDNLIYQVVDEAYDVEIDNMVTIFKPMYQNAECKLLVMSTENFKTRFVEVPFQPL